MSFLHESGLKGCEGIIFFILCFSFVFFSPSYQFTPLEGHYHGETCLEMFKEGIIIFEILNWPFPRRIPVQGNAWKLKPGMLLKSNTASFWRKEPLFLSKPVVMLQSWTQKEIIFIFYHIPGKYSWEVKILPKVGQ